MRRALILIFPLALVGCALPVRAESVGVQPPGNVILVGWDGCHRDHVKKLLKEGELPNLKQLISEGTMVPIDVTEVTDTKAGWSQILAGYEAKITGVYSNSRYQPIPRGYTVFERLKEFFGKDRFAAVAIVGKKGHVDAGPPVKIRIREGGEEQPAARMARARARKAAGGAEGPGLTEDAGTKEPRGTIVIQNGQKFRVLPGKPYYYTKDALDLWVNGLIWDDKVGDRALEELDRYKDKPFFFFVHFAQVDHSGHQSGEQSQEYDEAIMSGDKQLGRMVEKLKDLKLYDQTSIYVTADHGFDVGTSHHRNAPYVFLATNDKAVVRGGTRADIAPTILERFGVDLGKIEPPLTGEPLTRASTKAPTTRRGEAAKGATARVRAGGGGIMAAGGGQ